MLGINCNKKAENTKCLINFIRKQEDCVVEYFMNVFDRARPSRKERSKESVPLLNFKGGDAGTIVTFFLVL